MKKTIFAFLLLAATAWAQQDTAKPPTYGWTHSVVAGLTGTEVSYTAWSQGGENALGYTVTLNGRSVDDQQTVNWANSYKFAYGQSRLGNGGLRKTDDIIDLASVGVYKTGWAVNPYLSATLKSQFSRGYQYDATGTPTAVSDFFDPAYLMQSAGASYQPIPEVVTRLGAGLREVFSSEFASVYTDDHSTPNLEKSKVDGGFESATEVNWKIEENILLALKLELFDPFKHLDQVSVRSSNTLTMKISKVLVTILDVQLINEPQVSPRTQIKQTISLGVNYTLL